MKKNTPSPENAGRITELTAEGARLWVARHARLNQSLSLLISAIIMFVLAQLFGAMITNMLSAPGIHATQASTLFLNATFVGPALIFLLGLGLFIDSLRLRFKVEAIDLEMRRLDPEERLLTSWPEEFGRDIKAALDERRG